MRDLIKIIRNLRLNNEYTHYIDKPPDRLNIELIENSINFLKKCVSIKLFKIPIAPDNVYLYIDSHKQIWILYNKITLIKYQ